ncbi:MAG: hypothetical protein H8E15_14820 [Planctomycetes bacterium]|nr:hypothetical protein [Planctomycetota bacterium]
MNKTKTKICAALACGCSVMMAPALLAQQDGMSQGAERRFDPAWNPAIGVALDAFGMMVGGGDGNNEANDSITLRSMELSLSSRIDPLAWAYTSIEFGRHEGAYEVELAEAAIWADQLPHSFSLRTGRYLADFGKWNTVHMHDRPHPFAQGVRQEFIGGSLAMDGVELHHWLGIGDLPVRWSVGVGANFAGHGHSLLAAESDEDLSLGHAHGANFATTSAGDFGLPGFAWTGRVSAQHDVGDNGYFQWGASAFLTAAGLSQEHDAGATTELFELGQNTLAIDLTWHRLAATDSSSDTIGTEFFWNQRDAVDETFDRVERLQAVGLWGFYLHEFNAHIGAGVEGAWWEHADKDDGGHWLSGAEAGRQVAIFAAWKPTEVQRLRLILAMNQPDPAAAADSILAVQWSATIGSHSHSLDW